MDIKTISSEIDLLGGEILLLLRTKKEIDVESFKNLFKVIDIINKEIQKNDIIEKTIIYNLLDIFDLVCSEIYHSNRDIPLIKILKDFEKKLFVLCSNSKNIACIEEISEILDLDSKNKDEFEKKLLDILEKEKYDNLLQNNQRKEKISMLFDKDGKYTDRTDVCKYIYIYIWLENINLITKNNLFKEKLFISETLNILDKNLKNN